MLCDCRGVPHLPWMRLAPDAGFLLVSLRRWLFCCLARPSVLHQKGSSMAKPPSLMRKLSGASDAGPKESNASAGAAPPQSSEPAAPAASSDTAVAPSEPAPAVARKQESNSEASTKPWEAPAWRAHCAQEREAARQVKPYESDLVEVLGARFGCVASGDSGEERSAPERSDEALWHATADSLADLKRACLEYGSSAGGSKESLAARIYHPDQPDPCPKKRRRQAEILERRRERSAGE